MKPNLDKIIEEARTFIVINKKRSDLNLNPICPNCGRVMIKYKNSKYEFKCVCNPSLIMSLG
jgi:hypothetical protein